MYSYLYTYFYIYINVFFSFKQRALCALIYFFSFYFIFKEEKRKIPSTLRTILAVDAYLTNTFVNWAQQFLVFRQLKTHHTLLRVSLIISLLIK